MAKPKTKEKPQKFLKTTIKQKKFCDEYLKTGNGTEAVRRVYKTKNDNSAKVIASQNLTKTNIIEYLKENSNIAAAYITSVVENEEDSTRDRITAAKDVLDRAGYKPVEKTATIEFNINVQDMSTEELLDLIKK